MPRKRKSKQRTVLDIFADKKTQNCEEPKTSINRNLGNESSNENSLLDAKLEEFGRNLMVVVDQKLNQVQSNILLGDRKTLPVSKKRNSRVVYVRDETYPTFQKFKEKPDEPMKITLIKVARAAEKYLELTGGSKPH